MGNDERAAMADIELAKQRVSTLCKGGRWRMSIPVDQNDDDILFTRISASLIIERTRSAELLAALERIAEWTMSMSLSKDDMIRNLQASAREAIQRFKRGNDET